MKIRLTNYFRTSFTLHFNTTHVVYLTYPLWHFQLSISPHYIDHLCHLHPLQLILWDFWGSINEKPWVIAVTNQICVELKLLCYLHIKFCFLFTLGVRDQIWRAGSHFTLKGCEKLNPSMLTCKNNLFFSFEKVSITKFHYLLKVLYRKKWQFKKKSQVIQHLYGISEVNHVHDDLSSSNSFYGGLLKS